MTIPIGYAKSLTTMRFEHEGRVGELLPIVLLNALLNILTLGFYRFWARTRTAVSLGQYGFTRRQI